MTEKTERDVHPRLAAALLLLEKSVKHLDAVGVDKGVTGDCRKLLAFLRATNPTEIASILGPIPEQKRPKIAEVDAKEVEALTTQEIRSISSAPAVSRATLERIAERRFGVTKGALSNLRNREALREKLLTLTDHEDTHKAISKAATNQDADLEPDPDEQK